MFPYAVRKRSCTGGTVGLRQLTKMHCQQLALTSRHSKYSVATPGCLRIVSADSRYKRDHQVPYLAESDFHQAIQPALLLLKILQNIDVG